jgi:hypothetical protein
MERLDPRRGAIGGHDDREHAGAAARDGEAIGDLGDLHAGEGRPKRGGRDLREAADRSDPAHTDGDRRALDGRIAGLRLAAGRYSGLRRLPAPAGAGRRRSRSPDHPDVRSFAAIVTRSGRDFAIILRITRPRWAFTVISLIPSLNAICLFNRPETTNAMISRSRGVSDS